MFTVSLLSLVISTSLSANLSGQPTTVRVVPVQIAEYDPNDDPGKDLTRDPHDDVHDKDLPANNPDDYLKGDSDPKKDDE